MDKIPISRSRGVLFWEPPPDVQSYKGKIVREEDAERLVSKPFTISVTRNSSGRREAWIHLFQLPMAEKVTEGSYILILHPEGKTFGDDKRKLVITGDEAEQMNKERGPNPLTSTSPVLQEPGKTSTPLRIRLRSLARGAQQEISTLVKKVTSVKEKKQLPAPGLKEAREDGVLGFDIHLPKDADGFNLTITEVSTGQIIWSNHISVLEARRDHRYLLVSLTRLEKKDVRQGTHLIEAVAFNGDKKRASDPSKIEIHISAEDAAFINKEGEQASAPVPPPKEDASQAPRPPALATSDPTDPALPKKKEKPAKKKPAAKSKARKASKTQTSSTPAAAPASEKPAGTTDALAGTGIIRDQDPDLERELKNAHSQVQLKEEVPAATGLIVIEDKYSFMAYRPAKTYKATVTTESGQEIYEEDGIVMKLSDLEKEGEWIQKEILPELWKPNVTIKPGQKLHLKIIMKSDAETSKPTENDFKLCQATVYRHGLVKPLIPVAGNLNHPSKVKPENDTDPKTPATAGAGNTSQEEKPAPTPAAAAALAAAELKANDTEKLKKALATQASESARLLEKTQKLEAELRSARQEADKNKQQVVVEERKEDKANKDLAESENLLVFWTWKGFGRILGTGVALVLTIVLVLFACIVGERTIRSWLTASDDTVLIKNRGSLASTDKEHHDEPLRIIPEKQIVIYESEPSYHVGVPEEKKEVAEHKTSAAASIASDEPKPTDYVVGQVPVRQPVRQAVQYQPQYAGYCPSSYDTYCPSPSYNTRIVVVASYGVSFGGGRQANCAPVRNCYTAPACSQGYTFPGWARNSDSARGPAWTRGCRL